MPVLTACAPDPRRPGYRVIAVDRGRFASLPEAAVADLPLTVGQELAAAELARLGELADEEAAYRAAQRALARRAHARADLRRRLIKHQHPARAVDAALARLAAAGLLDERAFAERFAAVRATRGHGPGRLVHDLLAQGVSRSTAEAAVATVLVTELRDPLEPARRVAARRLGKLAALAPSERRRRLAAWLVRRGFGADDAWAVARELSPNS